MNPKIRKEKLKKICIVSNIIPPKFSGSGVRAYEYALRLNKKNRLAFILTQKPKINTEGHGFEFKRFTKISANMIVTVPGETPKHKKFNQSKLIYILSFILYQIHLFCTVMWKFYQKKDSFTIVHCIQAGSWISLYSVFIGKFLGKKTILEMTLLNGDDPLSMKNNTNNPINRFRYWLFSKADIIISISPALTKAYELSGMSMNRLRMVSNSVDIDKFCPIDKSKRSILRRRSGYKQNDIIILYVGAIIKRKGIDLLLKAFSKFRDKYHDAILVLVGPIPSEKRKKHSKSYSEYVEIKELVNHLNLKNNIQFTGIKDNINEYMNISDLFVFLSRNEGLPNVILEAMSTGIPVITLKIPGITEYLIEDNITGIIVNEANPTKIALEMENLLKDCSLYQKISINSRKTIMNKFTNNIIDTKYENIYKEIAD